MCSVCGKWCVSVLAVFTLECVCCMLCFCERCVHCGQRVHGKYLVSVCYVCSLNVCIGCLICFLLGVSTVKCVCSGWCFSV